MESDPKALRAIIERAAPDLDLAFRPMFGGIMAYAEGRPFASLSNVGLALKLDAASQGQLLKLRGTKRLQYEPDAPPSKSYIVVPTSLLKDRDGLRRWLLLAAAAPKAVPRPARTRGAGR